MEHETAGDLRRALLDWQIVSRFNPDEDEASQKIKALRRTIRSRADRHFSNGLECLRKGEKEAARTEFLATLLHDPDHKEALRYVKYELAEPDYVFYRGREGDSLKKIAQEVYKDPKMDFLVAYFHNLDDGGASDPGLVLKLPIVEPALTATARRAEETPNKGRTSRIREYPEEPSPLKNALDSAPYFRLQNEAEAHYKKGVAYFLAEELDKAVEEWEETLRLNPAHAKAKKDLEKARRLLEGLKKLR